MKGKDMPSAVCKLLYTAPPVIFSVISLSLSFKNRLTFLLSMSLSFILVHSPTVRITHVPPAGGCGPFDPEAHAG